MIENARDTGCWARARNAPTLLIAASGASYLTTFIRERFYYQRDLGTTTLDHIVVAVSIAAVISNMAGVAASLSWAAGRLSNRFLSIGTAVGVALLVTAVVEQGTVVFWLILVVASYIFLVGSQRAAKNGRLIYALLGAVTSPVPTIVLWSILGTHTARDVLAGYAAGATWQAAGAMWAGRRASIKREDDETATWWLPLLYIGAVQLDAVIDQVLLLRAGPGWAGAGTLSLTLSAAAVVLVLGPLSTQSLVGRLIFDKMWKILLIGFTIAVSFEAVVWLALPILLRGGQVNGIEYHRLLILTLLYGMIIPVSFTWQLMSRIAHRTPGRWASMSTQSLVIFSIHAVALGPLILYHLWYAFPLASMLAFGVGCLMMSRPIVEVETRSI